MRFFPWYEQIPQTFRKRLWVYRTALLSQCECFIMYISVRFSSMNTLLHWNTILCRSFKRVLWKWLLMFWKWSRLQLMKDDRTRGACTCSLPHCRFRIQRNIHYRCSHFVFLHSIFKLCFSPSKGKILSIYVHAKALSDVRTRQFVMSRAQKFIIRLDAREHTLH